MSEITIKIEAPDLTRAIMALAEAIGWHTASQTTVPLDAGDVKSAGPAVTAPEPPPEQPQPELAPPIDFAAAVSAAQLQQKAAELIRKGKRELVLAVIKKHGADKISAVADDLRAACLVELEELEGK